MSASRAGASARGPAVGRVVQLVVGKFGHLGEGGVGDRDRRRAPVAGELHGAHHERVRPAGREADHHRLVVDPAELGEALLARRGHHLGTQVEQHQEVAQVAREERHLVGAAEHDALRAGDQVHRGGHLVAIDLARGLGHVGVVRGQGGLELGLVDREERLGGEVGRGGAVLTRAPVFVARGGPGSGKPSNPRACAKRTTVELEVFARRSGSSAVWKAASSRWSTMYCPTSFCERLNSSKRWRISSDRVRAVVPVRVTNAVFGTTCAVPSREPCRLPIDR